MNHHLSRMLLLACATLFLNLSATGQTWQWGKRGGSFSNGANTEPHEKVVDLATDKNGNVYLIGYIAKPGSPNVDGNPITAYGEKDIILSSFSCNGTYRWSKVIGGGGNDKATAVGVDTMGHVYICGKVVPGINSGVVVHWSTDSVQAASNVKTIFLAQYDTSGNFQWLRQPSPDTADILRNSRYSQSYDIMVSGNGDVYWFAVLNKGLISGGNGAVAANDSGYIFKYNAAGTLTSVLPLPMDIKDVTFSYVHMSRTQSGKFILAGTQYIFGIPPTLTAGGQSINHEIFVAAFSPSGQFLWKRENTTSDLIAFLHSRPAIDAQENIYLSGATKAADVFNGYTFTNPRFGIASNMAFITKLDIAGNPLWTRNASASSAAEFTSVVMKGQNEVWLSGTGTSIWWDSVHRIQARVNEGAYIYTTRFSSQGTVLAMDSLKGVFGGQNWAQTSAIDRNGNLYIGGEFDNSLSVNGQTLTSAGGASDFFIAKLGSAVCGCSIPVASFNHTANARTVSLAYTGSTTGVDSVVWTYGNGIKATRTGSAISTAFSYTFPANGTYNICVTAYNACGSNQDCKSVTVNGLGISTAVLDKVKVYPNPASDVLLIEGATTGTTATLFSLVGQQVIEPVTLDNKQGISVKGIPAGVYFLQLTDQDHLKRIIRISKD